MITVTNFSFETLPAGGLTNGGCGTGCTYSISAIPGWTNSGFSGQFQPGTQDGNYAYFNSLDDGDTVAYTNGGTISQTVVPTVVVGVTYTLMVDLGWRNDTPFDATADLLINGVDYGATGTTPVRGNWSTYTATYVGLPADAGKSITIQLNAAGSQGDFDNVRLNDSIIASPEPGMAGMLGFALCGLGLLRRRRSA